MSDRSESETSFPRYINFQVREELTELPLPQSKSPTKEDGFPLRNTSWLPSWERIRAWCQYANWYGPDDYEGSLNASWNLDWELVTLRPIADVENSFEYPPASEEEIARVEEAMGFVHPPLLRNLYLHVANGGFGPGKGLTGVPPGSSGWWTELDPRYDDYLEDENYLPHRVRDCIPFDLARYEQQYPQARRIHLATNEWPTHFLHLCSVDNGESVYIHVKSGTVYLAAAGGRSSWVDLYRQADSLEDWFERWLNGEMKWLYPRE